MNMPDIAPLSQVQRDLVEYELRYNHAATDAELVEYFEECGITRAQALQALKRRGAISPKPKSRG